MTKNWPKQASTKKNWSGISRHCASLRRNKPACTRRRRQHSHPGGSWPRVRKILDEFADEISFLTPDVCIEEARRYLHVVAEKHRLSTEQALALFEGIVGMVGSVEARTYRQLEEDARERVQRRDPADWPLVALALLVGCPVWTEDQDLFGTGIPTWTTSTVEIYLRASRPE